jgi:hypothetical protein
MSSSAPEGNEGGHDAGDLLRRWLAKALPQAAAEWLDHEIELQREAVDERRFSTALAMVRRRMGGGLLPLPADALANAQRSLPRWRPDLWGIDEAVRVVLILATWKGDDASFAVRIERLCTIGELTEHVACLKGFAVFPAPGRLLVRARAAVRSSVQPIFEAIACQNPYPADHFDEASYNHMVVKCVFSGISINTIVGLDERRNEDLVRMMGDLVSERLAAGRMIPDTVHRWLADAPIVASRR